MLQLQNITCVMIIDLSINYKYKTGILPNIRQSMPSEEY